MNIISMSMGQTIRLVSRIRIGTGMFVSSTGTLTIRTSIIDMSIMHKRLVSGVSRDNRGNIQ